MKYYLFRVLERKDCLSNETRRIFPVMIYCSFCTLPNLSITELTNNTIKTLVFFITVFLSRFGAFLESSLIFKKKYVHFSKQFVQTAPHNRLPAKACNLLKIFS